MLLFYFLLHISWYILYKSWPNYGHSMKNSSDFPPTSTVFTGNISTNKFLHCNILKGYIDVVTLKTEITSPTRKRERYLAILGQH